jgi:hypothetical protein
MQITEHWLDVQYDLAVKFDAKPEHSMSAGVLRAQIYCDWLGFYRHALSF